MTDRIDHATQALRHAGHATDRGAAGIVHALLHIAEQLTLEAAVEVTEQRTDDPTPAPLSSDLPTTHADLLDQLGALLSVHQRHGAGACICGEKLALGSSFARHQAAAASSLLSSWTHDVWQAGYGVGSRHTRESMEYERTVEDLTRPTPYAPGEDQRADLDTEPARPSGDNPRARPFAPGWELYVDVDRERVRAHEKHGVHSIEWEDTSDDRAMRILVEEVGEVATALNEFDLKSITGAELNEALAAELLQVAAVATGWLARVRGRL